MSGSSVPQIKHVWGAESVPHPTRPLLKFRRSGSYSRLDRIDRHPLPVLVLELEADHAVDQGKQGIVVGAAHVLPGMKLGAALAHQDAARRDHLAAVALDAEILGVAVAAVAARADALLVCHRFLSRA